MPRQKKIDPDDIEFFDSHRRRIVKAIRSVKKDYTFMLTKNEWYALENAARIIESEIRGPK